MVLVLFTQDEIIRRNDRIEIQIARIAKGESEALGDLYELVRTDIYAFALVKCENAHDAEDATEEAFIKIYRYSSLYRPKGTPMSWIFTIVMNIIRDMRKQQGRALPFDESIMEQNGRVQDSAEGSLIKSDFIKRLMAMLDEGEREVVVMHAVSGLKHREIAKILDLPLSTVLSRYNRAIKKLQKEIGGDSV